MNFETHGLQITCPQGIVRKALVLEERDFLQAGQMRFLFSAEGVADEVVKETGTRVLSERGCGAETAEAGHTGCSFTALEEVRDEEGVSEGIQKEGSVCFEACCLGVSLWYCLTSAASCVQRQRSPARSFVKVSMPRSLNKRCSTYLLLIQSFSCLRPLFSRIPQHFLFV